jgi:hypothetical protein
MRLVSRIGLVGVALLAMVPVLGGCGGGSDHTTGESLRLGSCEVHQAGEALDGLEAGIDGLRPGSGRRRAEILQAMRENAASIREQLPQLEECAEDNYREATRGRPVRRPEPPPPAGRRGIAVADRLGPARVEPGEQGLPASPCSTMSRDPRPVYVYSDSPICARLTPGQRLLVVNDTGIDPHRSGAVAIRVRIGGYEVWIGPNQRGLIPAPVGSYLGRGSHQMWVAGGLGDTILVLPRVCAVRPPAAPGEELCFR